MLDDSEISSRVAKDLLKEAVLDGVDVKKVAEERKIPQLELSLQMTMQGKFCLTAYAVGNGLKQIEV